MNALDSFRLDGRVVVVTGGSAGLGAAAARALADAGAMVVVTGRRAEHLSIVAKEISGDSRVLDVADRAAVREVFADIAKEHGPLGVLVNNAGQAHQAELPEVSDEDWDRIVDVNLRGAFAATQAFVRHRVTGRSASVVNISSLAGAVGVRGQSAYTASKAGVEGLTRAAALDLARLDVRVNALAPGYFATDMPGEVLADEAATAALLRKVPQRRVADPAEIGPPVVFLASDASRFMTGAVLNFDGGYTAQ
ncbi:SDR family NAD(P)-dependent oxidoreductase [Amycolatopsis sp. Poz14]|uniref:SDR family NAD(P)-dependent oxidoreductase n=1 Tax=Amycolatopsis sp. Poz14 TaxID=1447705 RepID=UPI001EE9802A|nr:SDR family NAD(P)-dependent oxidoreductase [Amycolatopsis sp. Poz14]MCG3753957.1 SDR family oxidoreductase [Amycolatopsis sp. Poz14]